MGSWLSSEEVQTLSHGRNAPILEWYNYYYYARCFEASLYYYTYSLASQCISYYCCAYLMIAECCYTDDFFVADN